MAGLKREKNIRRPRGIFVNGCIVDVDYDTEQLAVLLAHYHNLKQQVNREAERLRDGSSDRRARWHKACLKVLGPEYCSLGSQVERAVELYCVALYLRFQASLTSMSPLRSLPGVSTLGDLVKRHPSLRKASSYKKVHELWFVYQASVNGRDSVAARQLKSLRPDYFAFENVEIAGRKYRLNPVFGNLAVAEKDFIRYASALKDFAKVIQKQLPIP